MTDAGRSDGTSDQAAAPDERNGAIGDTLGGQRTPAALRM